MTILEQVRKHYPHLRRRPRYIDPSIIEELRKPKRSNESPKSDELVKQLVGDIFASSEMRKPKRKNESLRVKVRRIKKLVEERRDLIASFHGLNG